jgi:hypothetical protein
LSFDNGSPLTTSEQFASSLKIVKTKIVAWAADRHRNKDRRKEVEEEIDLLFKSNGSGVFSHIEVLTLKYLEQQKRKMLV